MKSKQLIAAIMLATTFMIGCSSKEKVDEKNPPTVTDGTHENNNGNTNGTTNNDATTSASRATDEASLMKAAGKNGSWIIIVQKDLTVDKDVVVEGEITKPDKNDATKMVPAGRKLALYDQNDKKEITANYTLKAPKLIIKSTDMTIKGGTFVGDVYVESKNFTLMDTKIEGNVYFTNKEAQDTFKLGDNASVTGKTELQK